MPTIRITTHDGGAFVIDGARKVELDDPKICIEIVPRDSTFDVSLSTNDGIIFAKPD